MYGTTYYTIRQKSTKAKPGPWHWAHVSVELTEQTKIAEIPEFFEYFLYRSSPLAFHKEMSEKTKSRSTNPKKVFSGVFEKCSGDLNRFLYLQCNIKHDVISEML